ncbi:MAG TPA: DsbA family protein [Micromonosporaceae bacterium]
MALEVVEYTDPLCPWAWGSEPTLRRLRVLLGPEVAWRRCFGILFDDDDEPAPDPAAETRWYHRHLAEIAAHTGAPYPADLERVALSSRPASRAAIAAAANGGDLADRVLRRLREQMFLIGRPPDTDERVRTCIADLARLDHDRADDRLRRDWAETRDPVAEIDGVDGAGPHPGRAKPTEDGRRYAFPTLLFVSDRRRVLVAGWRPLAAYLDAAGVVDDGRVVAAEDALVRHRSLTRADLRSLCGTDRPPRNGFRVDLPGGPLWLHNDDVATHPATRVERPLNRTYSDGN